MSNYLRFSLVFDQYRKHPDAFIRLPQRGTTGAGAYDFFSPADYVIKPGQQVMIWTDVKAIMPQGLMLLLNVRSSMGKLRLCLANTQGWVDSDYANNPSNDGNIGKHSHGRKQIQLAGIYPFAFIGKGSGVEVLANPLRLIGDKLVAIGTVEDCA